MTSDCYSCLICHAPCKMCSVQNVEDCVKAVAETSKTAQGVKKVGIEFDAI